MSRFSDKDPSELWLSWLLRGGTLLALLLIVIGFALNFTTGQGWIASTDLGLLLTGSSYLRAPPPANLAEFVYGFRNLQSISFVQLAVLVLILLPSFRVAFLLGTFLRQRDLTFVSISAVVLLLLAVGFFSGLSE